MNKKFSEYAIFISNNWLVILATSVIIILIAWMYGYIMNGEHGAKYELSSCWTGISVITAITVVGFGKELMAHVTYYVDSKFNTNQGEKPKIGDD